VSNTPYPAGAAATARDLEQMLHLGPEMPWAPPVVKTATVDGTGIDDLWDAIQGHRKHLEASGELDRRRRARLLREVEEMVSVRLRDRLAARLEEGDLERLADDLVARLTDPYAAADILVGKVTEEKP